MLDRACARNAPLTRPRPGHADLAGMQKYGFDDARPVLERASARETAARVALGAVAQAFLEPGRRASRCSATSSRSAPVAAPAGVAARPRRRRRARRRPGALLRPGDQRARWSPRSTTAHKDGDTLGGVVEVVAYGLPPGLGSHVHWDRRLDARLAGALMGIQAIKGVEVGDGFELARDAAARRRTTRSSDRADGASGGAPAAPAAPRAA